MAARSRRARHDGARRSHRSALRLCVILKVALPPGRPSNGSRRHDRTKPPLPCSLALERVAPGGMGRAWPPGAAEHVTTPRSHLVLPSGTKPPLPCSLALERVAPGGMGRVWLPGAAEHVTQPQGKTRTMRVMWSEGCFFLWSCLGPTHPENTRVCVHIPRIRVRLS